MENGVGSDTYLAARHIQVGQGRSEKDGLKVRDEPQLSFLCVFFV